VVCIKRDVHEGDALGLILQAEREYYIAIDKAVIEGKRYVDERKLKQEEHIKKEKNEWNLFEVSENEKLQSKLAKEEQRIEELLSELKDELKEMQEKKADIISTRLKEEVLSIHGNR
jgi:peptidoglycan hydrolase CwlO-like protein